MNPVFVNDVFKLSGSLFRVLYIGGPHDRLYAIDLGAKNPLPQHWSRSHFENPGFSKAVQFVDPPEAARPYEPSVGDQLVGNLRWGRIQYLLKDHALELLDKETRGPLLKKWAEQIGSTDNTLLADLRLWWLGGQTQDALLGNYFRCGQIDENTAGAFAVKKKGPSGEELVTFAPGEHKARGRRPADESYEPMAMTSALRSIVLATAKAHYLKDEIHSVRGTTDHVIDILFCLRDEKGKPLRTPDGKRAMLRPRGQRPSIDQIRYLLKKALSETGSYKARVSDADFKNNHAPSSGSVKEDCVGPGDVYEIDATFIDLWLVADADGVTIIGKATLYLVIDRDSRLIVGFYLSLENPSWNEAKQAVLSISGDWESLCKRLGVAYDPADWPARGVMPNRFVGDRAEMITFASNVLCDGLRIPITNPPALASQRKCIVEGGFHTTQVPLKDNALGYEPPKNATARRGKAYDKDACMTLDQLAAIYLQIVIAHNNKVMAGYPSTPEEVYKGWLPMPVALWNRGIERRMGAPARHTYKFLRQKLMPAGVGRVHVDGIYFKGCVYKFDETRCADWQTRASLHGTFDVPVLYSPSLVDAIFIQDPHDKRKQYTGRLTPDFEPLSGYSYAEVVAFAKAKGGLTRIGEDLNDALRVALRQDMRAIAEPAHAKMKADTKGMQHGSRYRNAIEIRAAEALARRKQAHDLSGDLAHVVAPVDAVPQPPSPSPAPSPEPDSTAKVVSITSGRRSRPAARSAASPLPAAAVPAEALPVEDTVYAASRDSEPDVMDDILKQIEEA